MRTIGVATFARAEYSSCRPLLQVLRERADVRLQLWVGGMHLDPRFGETWREIERDGFAIHERIAMPMEDDSPESVTMALGHGIMGFARGLARSRPDILVLVADRTELLAAASAALIFNVPVAHISGGDVTEGAIDDQVRNAVSRMSHLHFVAMEEHAARLIRTGEEAWRVHVTGDPALDALRAITLLGRTELEGELGLPLVPPVMVLTHHPATLGSESAATEIGEVIAAVEPMPGTLIITYPNADAGHGAIVERLRDLARRRPQTALIASLGQERYYSLLALADVMLGNSSSGIWEAPSFQLPVVNIGDRQRGRRRAGNVIDVPAERQAVAAALAQALRSGFRRGLAGLTNPYGDGQAASRIAARLLDLPLDATLLRKRAPGDA